MTIEHTTTAPAPVEVRYVDWGAIFAGAALAMAVAVVLGQFGAAAGLAAAEPMLAEEAASWQVLVAGLWVILVAVASASAGGYVAGRLRAKAHDATASEVEFRDGAHGLIVWATATLGAALLGAILSALAANAGEIQAEQPELSDFALRITANVSAIFAFATAAAAALSAAAAFFAGKAGGEHRDEGVTVDALAPKFLRRS